MSAKLHRKYGCNLSRPVDFLGSSAFNLSITIPCVISIDTSGIPYRLKKNRLKVWSAEILVG